MSDKKLGQKPAFPYNYTYYKNGGQYCVEVKTGISTRLLIAKDAMCAIITKEVQFGNNIGLPDITMTVREAYAYADKLLEQENE